MSWYKRRPRVKEPPKLISKTTSPMASKHLKQAKELTQSDDRTATTTHVSSLAPRKRKLRS